MNKWANSGEVKALLSIYATGEMQLDFWLVNCRPAYVTTAFLLTVRIQTEKRPWRYVVLGGSPQWTVPLRESPELFDPKTPYVCVSRFCSYFRCLKASGQISTAFLLPVWQLNYLISVTIFQLRNKMKLPQEEQKCICRGESRAEFTLSLTH